MQKFKSLIAGLAMMFGVSGCMSDEYCNGENKMMDEIYSQKTIPGEVEMVEGIVVKYFPIGTNKQLVVEKLQTIGVNHIQEDKNKNIIYFTCLNKPAYAPDSKTIEINFYFNKNNKLEKIFSRLYNTI